jgi:hypothetical protein
MVALINSIIWYSIWKKLEMYFSLIIPLGLGITLTLSVMAIDKKISNLRLLIIGLLSLAISISLHGYGKFRYIIWRNIILVLIIYFSYLDITTPSPDSFNLSGLLTVFLAFGMAVVVLISLIILGILVMKKFIEKRIEVK